MKDDQPSDTTHAAAEPPPGESFRDVNRACHRFLMERDPAYARDYERQSARSRAAADKRKR